MEKAEKEHLRAYLMGIVSSLPECPGCYQYLDETGTIIYVGKAKNLKRRAHSWIQLMLGKIEGRRRRGCQKMR